MRDHQHKPEAHADQRRKHDEDERSWSSRTDDRAPAGLGDRRAGVAADQRVRRARRQTEAPRDEIPDDRADQAGENDGEADDGNVDEAGPDGLGDRRPEGERRDEIEEGRPDDGLPGVSTRVDTTVAIELAAS